MSDSEDTQRTRNGSHRGLLFRIGGSKRPEAKCDPVESVVENLRAVLNSDRGMSPSCPELGLGLHQMLAGWKEQQQGVLDEVKRVIELYEPRLQGVKVEALAESSTFRLSVLIRAFLPSGESLSLRTDMRASGAAHVEQIVADD